MKNKDAEKNNPCLKEQELSYKCFNDNNFDKEACELEIFNYRTCKSFWHSVKTYRRRKGIYPLLPPVEERESIKREFRTQFGLPKTMGNKIKLSDIVWAKLSGYPPWPSLILKPDKNVPKKPSSKNNTTQFFWVYFLGSHDYAWVEKNNIKPYFDYKEKYVALHKTSSFQEAVEETEDILVEMKHNSNYKVSLQPFQQKKTTKRTRDSRGSVNSRKRSKSTTSFTEAETESVASTRRHRSQSQLDLSLKVLKMKNITPTNLPELETDSIAPTQLHRPQPQFDDSHKVLKTKNITTSNFTFGVLGIGIIGSGVVKNLIQSGHKVNIWNRTTRRCTEIEALLGSSKEGYLKTYLSPRAVMENSDIVCNCVSDHNVSKQIIQNFFGINNPSDMILSGKGFLEMTGTDPEASKDLRDMIEKKGGKYLEVQVQGSKIEAMEGSLVVLAAGNQSLFFDCQPCFKAIGAYAIFLGEVGYATKVNLILQLIRGVTLVGIAEGLAMAERSGLALENFLNIFRVTNLSAPYLAGKASIIVGKNFYNVEQSLQNMQKDMKLGLELSDKMGQPMEMASAANEIFKHCCRFDFSDQDASCIYMRTRF